MNDRTDAIIALLRSRDEGLPENAPRSHAPSGFVEKVTVTLDCADCLERRLDGRSTFGCETCGGSSFVEEYRDRDPYAVNEVQPFGLTPNHHEATRRRDAELARLEVQTQAPWKSPEDEIDDANRNPHPWEIERRKLYRRFDYGALDAALEQLRDSDLQAYHVLHSVYVYGYSAHSASLSAVVLRGLTFLSHRLPDPLRAPGFEVGWAGRKAERVG